METTRQYLINIVEAVSVIAAILGLFIPPAHVPLELVSFAAHATAIWLSRR